MTVTLIDEAYAAACARTAYILLKRPQKNIKRMKGICYDIAPNLPSTSGYREQQFHNRMIGPHLS